MIVALRTLDSSGFMARSVFHVLLISSFKSIGPKGNFVTLKQRYILGKFLSFKVVYGIFLSDSTILEFHYSNIKKLYSFAVVFRSFINPLNLRTKLPLNFSKEKVDSHPNFCNIAFLATFLKKGTGSV